LDAGYLNSFCIRRHNYWGKPDAKRREESKGVIQKQIKAAGTFYPCARKSRRAKTTSGTQLKEPVHGQMNSASKGGRERQTGENYDKDSFFDFRPGSERTSGSSLREKIGIH
jgi:hypothetical protein